ncbi:MAG: hypothetical protein H6Q37_2607 [Chloroflexi bacterium]|jgi:hypothetical protein|nr:hypothetical protein [Chloroflexota bacterium]
MNPNQTPQFVVRTGVRAGQGGGYVNGVWYPDRSGECGGTVPPTTTPPTTTPPTTGGGYVNGVWYPDQSGSCG